MAKKIDKKGGGTAGEVWLLNEAQVAERIGYTRSALRSWRCSGRGPKFVKVSQRSIRYRKQDIDSWVEALVRSSTSDMGT